MNIFVFDIETIPDIANLKKIYELQDLNDVDALDAAQTIRRQEHNGSAFFPLHLQKIVAISAVLKTSDTIKVWSLGSATASEKELIERFYLGIEKYSPTLVSWNGGGFDLPVLHYRSLLHGVTAARYWEAGDSDPLFRYNNYLNRYHYRHMDLMDIFACYQARANAPLDDIAIMLGLPGKMGMHGSKVWEYFQRGEIAAIRNYCETDILNTYLVYLRFELIRGRINEAQYQMHCADLKTYLISENKTHFTEFLNLWTAAA